jgi:hypothetical protein
MSIDERRAKRRTSTLPGVAPPEPPATIGPGDSTPRAPTVNGVPER